MAQKRRTAPPRRRTASTRKSAAIPSSRQKSSRRGPDLQTRAYQVFAEQAVPLWNDLTYQCEQFAAGFNRALGSDELHVEAAGTTIRVAYPRADAVLSVALDTAERFVQATLDNGCADRGSCAADQPAVGLTVNGNDLRFVLAGEIVSNEQLAVELLTKLTRDTADDQQS